MGKREEKIAENIPRNGVLVRDLLEGY